MERWVENTFRTLGILALSGFVLIASGLLLLLSICASGGSFSGTKNSGAAFGYMLGAVVVFGLGVYSIVRLARGFFRSSSAGSALQQGSQTQVPAVFTLTPEARRITQVLVYLIIAKIVAGYIGWLLMTRTPNTVYTPRFTVIFASFLISQLPFIILGAVLLMRPGESVLTLTVVFTTISVLKLLPALQLFFIRFRSQGPLALTLVALIFEIAIIALAFKALQKSNTRLQPPTIVVAVVCTLIYYFVLSIATPALYRLR